MILPKWKVRRDGSMNPNTLKLILNKFPPGKILTNTDIAKLTGSTPQGVRRLIGNMLEVGLLEKIDVNETTLEQYKTTNLNTKKVLQTPKCFYRFAWIRLQHLGNNFLDDDI